MPACPAPRLMAVLSALFCMLGVIVALSCGQDSATNPYRPKVRAAAVRVAPETLTVDEGASITVKATVLDAAGHELTDHIVVWGVSDTVLATVSMSGIVAGRRAGTVTVTATVDRVVGTATVTVTAARVGSVTHSLVSQTIRVYETTGAVATVLDVHGNVLAGRMVTFASNDVGVATVSNLGVITGTGIGVATIGAASGGMVAGAEVRVTAASVAGLAIAPLHGTLMAGQALVITAVPLDKAGRPIAGESLRFGSSNPAVATVSETGLVTAVVRGRTVIVATSEAKSATTTVSVLDATDGNWVRLDSDPDDWLGMGDIYTYTAANAAMSAGSHGTFLGVSIVANDRQPWGGSITLPSALGRLQPGTFQLSRPTTDPAVGSLDWFYSDRGCNTVAGSTTIDTVRYVGELLAAIDLSFVQHCEEDWPALRGTLHWRADLAPPPPVLPPGPISPIPADLWAPPADRVPSSGNWVYLESDSAEWVGQGRTYVYVWPTAAIDAVTERATMGDGLVNVVFAQQSEVWYVIFQAPAGFRGLPPGYYPGVTRYYFHDRARGGLEAGGLGRSCNALTGWFATDSASYRGDTLTVFDGRFEQHCEGAKPALRGAVHWRRASMFPASSAGLRPRE